MKVVPIVASPKANNDGFKNCIEYQKRKKIADGFKDILKKAVEK